MKAKLEKKLLKKYPKIFRQKGLSPQETCMCWGIDTGDGWYWLIDNLCSSLQWDIDHNGFPQIEATQVKEKFGGLRWYYIISGTKEGKDLANKCGTQRGMVTLAEFMSNSICEECGSTKDVTQTKGWISTLCKTCMKERNENNNRT